MMLPVVSDQFGWQGYWNKRHLPARLGERSLPIGQGVVGKFMLPAIFGTTQAAFCRGLHMGQPASPVSGLTVSVGSLGHGHPPSWFQVAQL